MVVCLIIFVEFGWWPWCYEAARSANTPADRSKRATQLSPGAALPALCLLCSGRFGFAVHQIGDSLYGISGKSFLVHQIGDSLYGTVQNFCLVHGSSCLVYGDKDYDKNGQEKGAYFGRWRRIFCGGQEKGTYFGRLKRIDAAAKKRALILVLLGVWGFVTK